MLAHLKIIWQFHQKVSRFLGPRYIGDDFFLGPNLVSFNRAVVPLFELSFSYERGYETSGSPLHFMLRRSSLVECVSVLPGNRCLQNVEFFFLRQYVQPYLLKNPKYTFYTIKSSLKLAYKMSCTWWPSNRFPKNSPRLLTCDLCQTDLLMMLFI